MKRVCIGNLPHNNYVIKITAAQYNLNIIWWLPHMMMVGNKI